MFFCGRRGINGPVVATAETPGILHCNQPRRFWLAWYPIPASTFRLGFGWTNFDNQFLGYYDTNAFPIAYAGVATSVTTRGAWYFPQGK